MTLADPNLASEAVNQFAATLADAQVEFAKIKPIKEAIDAQLAAFEARLAEIQAAGPVDAYDEMALAQAVLTAAGGAVGGKAGLYMALAAFPNSGCIPPCLGDISMS